MNVYSELWELLRPVGETASPVCFGTVTGFSPREVTVGGQAVRSGLRWPRGTALTQYDLGREVALLPLSDGFLVLFQVEGGEDI